MKSKYLTGKLAAIITVICCGCICVFVPATAKTEKVERLPIISQVDRVSSAKNRTDFYDFDQERARLVPKPLPSDSADRQTSIAQLENRSAQAAHPKDICWENKPAPALVGIQADLYGSGAVRVSNVMCLIDYCFAGGPAPDPLALADFNCTKSISISDAVSLINYICAGGSAPCAGCP